MSDDDLSNPVGPDLTRREKWRLAGALLVFVLLITNLVLAVTAW